MKKAFAVSAVCTLLFLFMTGSALAQPFTPEECAVLDTDPNDWGPCCNRANDEPTRVETARRILKVHARTVGNPPVPEDDSHYTIAINGWAVNGSGEDLDSSADKPAVYQEAGGLSNLTRQEMWDYLEAVFAWSSDMELVISDEVWETHPDDSMTYMLVNKWFGSTDAGYYEQPGISIVKFRPGEGCASYQKDYFTEGDTYWGMSFAQGMVRDRRNTVITELGLTGKCVDDDGDGYTKYEAATGCAQGTVVDCDDYHAEINPGAEESTVAGNCADGLDNDCDGLVDGADPGCS